MPKASHWLSPVNLPEELAAFDRYDLESVQSFLRAHLTDEETILQGLSTLEAPLHDLLFWMLVEDPPASLKRLEVCDRAASLAEAWSWTSLTESFLRVLQKSEGRSARDGLRLAVEFVVLSSVARDEVPEALVTWLERIATGVISQTWETLPENEYPLCELVDLQRHPFSDDGEEGAWILPGLEVVVQINRGPGGHYFAVLPLDGPVQLQDADGALWMEGEHCDGRRHGLFRFYRNGRPHLEQHFEGGRHLRSEVLPQP